jgi:hypothetical protein
MVKVSVKSPLDKYLRMKRVYILTRKFVHTFYQCDVARVLFGKLLCVQEAKALFHNQEMKHKKEHSHSHL